MSRNNNLKWREGITLTFARYGHGESGSVETHQYSVTSHKRSLAGGTAQDEGHKERLHARGGIPGVFFSFGEYLMLSMSSPSLLRFISLGFHIT